MGRQRGSATSIAVKITSFFFAENLRQFIDIANDKIGMIIIIIIIIMIIIMIIIIIMIGMIITAGDTDSPVLQQMYSHNLVETAFKMVSEGILFLDMRLLVHSSSS